VDKLAVWVLISLLAYICFVLTSINSKLVTSELSGAQYAVLNEVKPNSLSDVEAREVVMAVQPQSAVTSSNAAIALIAVVSIFVSWHFSRLYHNHEWTKSVLRKRYAAFTEPYTVPVPHEPLHLDQDCVGDPPPPDGGIKNSWLPTHLRRLDAGQRG
jgi:hypothetical protein